MYGKKFDYAPFSFLCLYMTSFIQKVSFYFLNYILYILYILININLIINLENSKIVIIK